MDQRAQLRAHLPARSRWLRRVRLGSDLGQAEFADKILISRPYFSNMERGARPVPDDVVKAVRNSFPDAPPPPEDGFVPDQDSYTLVPYAGVLPAGAWGDPLQAQELRPIEAKYGGSKRFLCSVVGDSCEPALKSGDLTLWEAQEGEPYGLIVAAERMEDHACTVKLLKRDQGRDRLLPINPEYEEPTAAEGFKIAAFLVGVFRSGDVERSWFKPGGLRPESLSL